MNQSAKAGDFLRDYENQRYSFRERHGLFPTITVEPDAEEFADVSFYQRGMNWEEYAKHARAAILRIGQGNWPDSEFEINYAGATRNHLAVGGYWFFDDRYSPLVQAQLIRNALIGKRLDMELLIDYEKVYGGPYGGIKNVAALMKILEGYALPVKAVGVYSGYYFFTEHNDRSNDAYLSTKPLWLAWYASPSTVKVPLPWKGWTHWQKSTPVVQWGQPTAEIDMNVHNGTRAQFAERYLNLIPTQKHLVELYVDKILVHSQEV